jgi:Flp pilus assembly protein protease CpaA
MSDAENLRTAPREQWRWFAAALTPVILAWMLAVSGDRSLSWLHACTLALVWYSGAVDVRCGRIPNHATYTAVAWALAINSAPQFAVRFAAGSAAGRINVGDMGLAESVAGLVIGFAVMIVGYLMAGSGAGDVKLSAALGALLGWRVALQCLLATFIIAGAAVTIWLVWTRGPRAVARALFGPGLRLIAPAHAPLPTIDDATLLAAPVPMGAFFALGTTLMLFW